MCPSGRRLGEKTRNEKLTRSAFDVLDADNDGKISIEDLRSFYAYPGAGAGAGAGTNGVQEYDDVVIGTMMRAADLNKDGFVEYEEFQRVLVPVPDGNGTSNSNSNSNSNSSSSRMMMMMIMEEAFKVMDKDGDGILSLRDLEEYMAWAGFHVSHDDILAMISFASGTTTHLINHNHGVTFHDFLRILAL